MGGFCRKQRYWGCWGEKEAEKEELDKKEVGEEARRRAREGGCQGEKEEEQHRERSREGKGEKHRGENREGVARTLASADGRRGGETARGIEGEEDVKKREGGSTRQL
ncbi:hypothetical protein MUK42_22868 [Musa troglodytarum]|uniref:Uncharacterized protein n=1 Tax=Musa troglodytarum TaxID=320322 RepID=A0A9E7EP32_9LILI|nr:hypothetical protein MUK42_22868 [Musa troglodytarum]